MFHCLVFFFPFQIWFWKDGNFLLLFACLSLNLFVLLLAPSYLISPLVLWSSKLRSYFCSCWIVFWELILTRAWGIFCRRCAATLVIARVHWGAQGIYTDSIWWDQESENPGCRVSCSVDFFCGMGENGKARRSFPKDAGWWTQLGFQALRCCDYSPGAGSTKLQ